MSDTKSVPRRDSLALWVRSAGRCNFYGCGMLVAEPHLRIGEQCHIHARNEGGARWLPSYQGNINGYDNLILMCPNHHAEIDAPENGFSADFLRNMKRDHENRVDEFVVAQFNSRDDRHLAQELFEVVISVTSLRQGLSRLPEYIDDSIFDSQNLMQVFAEIAPGPTRFFDLTLQAHFQYLHDTLLQIIDNAKEVAGVAWPYRDGQRLSVSPGETREKVKACMESARDEAILALQRLVTYMQRAHPQVSIYRL